MYKQIILSNPKYGVTGNFNIEKNIMTCIIRCIK